MVKNLSIALFALILFSSNAHAGFYSSSSDYSREAGTVVAAVEIKDVGLYNLVVTIQFLRKPQNTKIYKSEKYEKLVDRLLVESRGITLQRILEQKDLSVSDFAVLKKNIESDIGNLAAQLKKKIIPEQETEVVFSISDFFLLEPTDK
jgi:methylase of polypeptide subunit release factors